MSPATSAAASPIDLFRRPLDPLQQRGHFFYLCEDGDAPWSIGWSPTRRAGDYEVERISLNRFRISNTVNGLRATMELGPDPQGRDPELAHQAGEPRRSGARAAARQLLRNRRPRGRRLCARPRLRRHARRDDVRARAQRHFRPQSVAALGARRSRRDLVLRREARRRLPTDRLRGFAHALPRRRLARQADRLRAVARAQDGRRRQAVDLRSRRQLHPRSRARRSRRRRRPNSSSAAPTTRCGRPNSSPNVSACRRSPRSTSRSDSTRRARSSRRRRCPTAGRSPFRPTAGRCCSPIARRGRGRW